MMQPEGIKIQEIAERGERFRKSQQYSQGCAGWSISGNAVFGCGAEQFSYQMDGRGHGFGTDGRVMYFQPQMLGGFI